jgi:hypothetical protein
MLSPRASFANAADSSVTRAGSRSARLVVSAVLYKEGDARYLSAFLGVALFGWVPWLLWRGRGVFQPPPHPVTGR